MKSCQDMRLSNFLTMRLQLSCQQQRDAIHQDAKKQIYEVQNENRRTYNLRRRQAHKYQSYDLVAIKRTQFGPGLKLNPLTGYLPPEKLFRKRFTLILLFPSKMQQTSILSPF
ncbi:hypothetical protein TNCV_4146521 [Trichonephila clavipes]|nr:hypothetical protein TNCV_4146521 [Trichonephila clavipes]